MPNTDKNRHNLFRSAHPGAFAFGYVAGRYWFSLPPCQRPAGYPLLVDFFETDFSMLPDADMRALMAHARQLAAPSFDVVSRMAPDDHMATLSFEDTEEQESGFPNIEKLTLLAETVARLGAGYGLVVPSPEFLDGDTQSFVSYLADAAAKTGFGILWGLPADAASASVRAAECLLDADSLLPSSRASSAYIELDQNHEAYSLMAACGTALSLEGFRAAGYRAPTKCKHGYVFAPYVPRTDDAAGACRALLARVKPEGYGYLRQHRLLLEGGDCAALIRQHQIYRAGLTLVGKEFLYRHYLAVADAKASLQGDELGATYARLAAARLAPRVAVRDGFGLAVAHFRTALECPDLQGLDRADTCQQLANVLAVRGGAEELHQAEQYNGAAERSLAGEGLSERLLRIRIRVLNGRALIEYKSGRPAAAEALEDQALALASKYRSAFPAIHGWANSLIKTNLATLHLRAYNDRASCIALTSEVLSATEDLNDEQSVSQAVRLAALLASDRQFDEATDILAQTFHRSGNKLGEVEVYAVLLYASLLARAGKADKAATLVCQHRLAIETVGADYARDIAHHLSGLGAAGAMAVLH